MMYVKKQLILLLVVYTTSVAGMNVSSFRSLRHIHDDRSPDLQNSSRAQICRCNPCQNDGTCEQKGDSYKCRCPSEYAGVNCERKCECGAGIPCSFEKGKKICTCYAGSVYSEGRCKATCENDVDCQNWGICEPDGENQFCSCYEGLKGDRCEIIIDCVEDGRYKDCEQSGGTCSYDTRSKISLCECTVKKKFNDETNVCEECDCGPYGVCNFVEGLKKCNCIEGFTDEDGACTELDLCISEPCQNGGICVQEGRSFICKCQPPYFGVTCEKEIDHCISGPCQNGGICVQKESSFSCNCKPPYFGATCEKDPCTENPCQNGGTCHQVGYSFKCQCRYPFSGDTCQYVDACNDNPCFNGGTCVNIGDSFKCKCKYGYIGIICEQEGYESTTEEIINLTTVEDDGNYTTENYTEPTREFRNFTSNFNFTTITTGTCARDIDCLNGGICRNSNCVCQPHFEGHWCERNTLCERLDPTCRTMGATCKIVGLHAICDCPPVKMYQPRSGMCEDICNPWKCSHGRCEIEGRAYKCICDKGYIGQHCSEIVPVKVERSNVWFAVITSLLVLICLFLILRLCLYCGNQKSNLYAKEDSTEYTIRSISPRTISDA